MKKEMIRTEAAPAPIGPYNQAVWAGDTLYVSGQIALDPANGALVAEDIEKESEQVMKNLQAVLNAAGLDFTHVVKTSIFLKNMGDFGKVNEVYGRYFTSDFPARETIQAAALPKDVNVEISLIAVK